MTLESKLKGIKVENKDKPKQPVWDGPEADTPNGGVTFSLLSRFLTCRERFRVYAIEGLRAADTFSHRLEFGSMWHLCEECLAANAPTRSPNWQHALVDYAKELARKYPTQYQQVEHWMNVVRTTFPIYVDYWREHPDVVERTPLLQEQVFKVPYKLPSGRSVYLRGRFDAVDLVGKGKQVGVYLGENKTKGDIDEDGIKRQLLFDLQTMIYLVALECCPINQMVGVSMPPIKGVRYNVVRRPLSGGKGSIVRHKPTKSNPEGESKEHYYARLGDVIREDPAHFFMRWRVEVSPADIQRFRQECLDPILEALCDWYAHMVQCKAVGASPFSPYHHNPNTPGDATGYYSSLHWRHPYGAANAIDEGFGSDVEVYLESGSTTGLQRVTTLFRELED